VYKRILVPTDGSACSDAAVAHALTVAKAMDSTVVFLFVIDSWGARSEGVVSLTESREALTAQGQPILATAEGLAMMAGVRSESVIAEGVTADTIVHKAREFDLVVMGSHGRQLFRRMTLGSVARAVLHRVSRPVLVVRALGNGAD
jgi:nucleotide-binding universal stress UspA family protein